MGRSQPRVSCFHAHTTATVLAFVWSCGSSGGSSSGGVCENEMPPAATSQLPILPTATVPNLLSLELCENGKPWPPPLFCALLTHSLVRRLALPPAAHGRVELSCGKLAEVIWRWQAGSGELAMSC